MLSSCGGVGNASTNTTNQIQSHVQTHENLINADDLIQSFSLHLVNQESVVYSGVISGSNITIIVPSVSESFVAKFTTKDTVQYITVGNNRQISGTTINHFDIGVPLNYVVWLSPTNFFVYKVVTTSSNNQFQSFSLIGRDNRIYSGMISESIITVPLPDDAVGMMTADFTTNDAQEVLVDGVPQVSGSTQNMFTFDESITYSVIAFDGESRNYSVVLVRKTGVLSPLNNYTIDDSGPIDIAINPNNKYLYVVQGALSAYEIKDNGDIAKVTASNQAQNATKISISNNGTFAAIVNQSYAPQPSDSISIYALTANGAQMSLVESVVTQDNLSAITIAPDNSEVYAIGFHNNQLLAYTVDDKYNLGLRDAVALPGIPSSIATSNDGKFIYVLMTTTVDQAISKDDFVGIAVIDKQTLKIQATLDLEANQPSSMAFSADDKHAYITTLNSESMPGSITVYDRDVNTGILSRSPAPVLGTGKVPYKVIRAANQFLYVTNSLGSKYTAKIGTVSMYRINSDGSISYATSLDSGIVYSGGIFPMAIASDTVGDHVFVQNLYSHNIQAFAIR